MTTNKSTPQRLSASARDRICFLFLILSALLLPLLAQAQDVAVDLRNASSATQYMVRFCARLSGEREFPGHAFLMLEKVTPGQPVSVEAWGFYPKDGEKLGLATVPGQIYSEFQKAGIPEGSCRLTTLVSQDHFEALQAHVQEWRKKEYTLTWQNCITFIHEAAGKLGLPRPTFGTTILPSRYIQSLVRANQTTVQPIP